MTVRHDAGRSGGPPFCRLSSSCQETQVFAHPHPVPAPGMFPAQGPGGRCPGEPFRAVGPSRPHPPPPEQRQKDDDTGLTHRLSPEPVRLRPSLFLAYTRLFRLFFLPGCFLHRMFPGGRRFTWPSVKHPRWGALPLCRRLMPRPGRPLMYKAT